MSPLSAWLLAFGALLVAYATYWGLVLGRRDRSADDFFLAGRSLPAWLYVLSATALSVSGWLALGHPAMVAAAGLPYAEVALAAAVIPLAGVLFVKRQWLAARQLQVQTPAALFGRYYDAELLRLLTLLVALVFAVPFAGMQLSACGELIERLSGGAVDRHGASWIVGFCIFVYVYLGGMRAVAAVGGLQCVLMLAGMVGMGCLAYWQLGGVEAFGAALARLAEQPGLFEIPGVIQFSAGLGKEAPAGGVWTSAMILSYGFALLGVQAAPAFSMLACSSRDARGFGAQQVWAGAAVVGAVLLFFAVAQGFGARLLGDEGAAVEPLLRLAQAQPWLAALLAVCLMSAIALAVAAHAWTTAAMLSRDLCQRYFARDADDRRLRVYARTALALIFVLALSMGTFTPQAQAQLGTLALAFALQLWPVLAGLCWLPWITRQGATVGLCVGLFAVVLTEPVGASITRFLGFDLPWGRWPWTIHSAGWGVFCNMLACTLVSLASRGGDALRQRQAHHAMLRAHDALTPRGHVMRPAVWALTLLWFFFALGPGAVIGNDLFDAPPGGLPSLWIWQAVWWALGVFVLWWLAYRMELSTPPRPPGQHHP